MKLGLLCIGQVPLDVVTRVKASLEQVFPNTTCNLIAESLPLPEHALDKKRNQYKSSMLLNLVTHYITAHRLFDGVLGVVDVDIFVSGLNFIFGEAMNHSRAALISLWRLRPEFYGVQSDPELFYVRSAKEATHEVGHTLGLNHCTNPNCVMFFSNSIADTDRKQNLFCSRCASQVALKV